MSQNVGVFFFFSGSAKSDFASREFRSTLGTSARSIFFPAPAKKRDRVNPETSVSRVLRKLAMVSRIAYGLLVRGGTKLSTRFRVSVERKRVSRTSPPESYCVKTSESDALRDAHARSFSTLAMSGSVTRAPALACDRAELQTGIVHFGVGGFHRSHQQVRLPFRKSLFFGENAFRVKRRTRREARASPRRARTRAHRDESPRIRRPELPTSSRARFRTSTASHPRSARLSEFL